MSSRYANLTRYQADSSLCLTLPAINSFWHTWHHFLLFSVGSDRTSTPHAMQWAIRANAQSRGPSNSGLSAAQTTAGSGFIYVDSTSLRSRTGNNAAAAGTGSSDLPSVSQSMTSSASALARAFGIVVREVSCRVRFSFFMTVYSVSEDPSYGRFFCFCDI